MTITVILHREPRLPDKVYQRRTISDALEQAVALAGLHDCLVRTGEIGVVHVDAQDYYNK